jgi:hypothetical protein
MNFNEELFMVKRQYDITKRLIKMYCENLSQAQLYELSGMKRRIDYLERNTQHATRNNTQHATRNNTQPRT